MRRALIHTVAKRLCEVRVQDFPVHADLEWRDCANEVTPTTHEFDGQNIVAKPPPPPPHVPTPEELEAQALAALNGGGSYDSRKLFKAKMISDLAFRLGKTPGTLTAAEILAERNRIAAIYKAL